MSGRHITLLMAGGLLLASPILALQDHAVPRGGGGGSSSGSGAQHTPSFHSSDSGGSGGSSSSGPYASSGSTSPGLTPAQQRHPRPGTGSGGGGYYPCYGCGYYPGYYPGYWGYWWPYGSYGWWGTGYGGWGYPWGGGYAYVEGDHGSIRVLVDPPDARVYVDGYYAGVVDDFDGLFQRLNVSPGKHEITLKLEGYKSHHMRLYLTPGATLKLRYEMAKGSGDTFEDLAGELPEHEVQGPRPYDGARPSEGGREESAPANVLRLIVHPSDASVYVDGEFRGSGAEIRSLAMTPGRHRIEVVRPGYRTQDREVDIGPQASTEVTIELEKP